MLKILNKIHHSKAAILTALYQLRVAHYVYREFNLKTNTIAKCMSQ